MNYLHSVILAVIEGVTEFLPVSSTGHMIIASSLLGIAQQDFTKLFTIVIQCGAILSVVVLYWRRFVQGWDFYLRLLVGVLPSLVIGKLFAAEIDQLLGNVVVVAVALFAGGVGLIFVDRWIRGERRDEMPSYLQALVIGLFQVVAMVPGVSRAAATILGGLSQGLSRRAAAEFSFFLAVPTMLAASLYKLYTFTRHHGGSAGDDILVLCVGGLVAFATAWLAIRSFIAFLNRHGFRYFGYYRFGIGAFILILYFFDRLPHGL